MRPIEPVMLPTAAGIPPQVAHVPIAMVTAARGASAQIQSEARSGWSARRGDCIDWGQSAPTPRLA
jgi:hypothetical protein